jgi:hypothetical protein
MRSIRYSKTFTDVFEILLDQGEMKFGSAVAESKKQLVRSTITGHLATFPLTGHVEPEHGLYMYAVRRSPLMGEGRGWIAGVSGKEVTPNLKLASPTKAMGFMQISRNCKNSAFSIGKHLTCGLFFVP